MGLVYGRKSTAKTQDTRTENQFCAQRNGLVRKQKQRSAFQILPQAKQFACLLPMEQKNTPDKWECFLLLNGGQYRICLPVVLLTQTACRPGSRFLPFVVRRQAAYSSNKNIAPPFESLRNTKQLVLLQLSCKLKSSHMRGI